MTLLHNMSVPSTSTVRVVRAVHPGLRLHIALASHLSPPREGLRERLGRGGWLAAWEMLEALGEAPPRAGGGRRRPEALERHLEDALRKAGVPDRVGVFLEEDAGGDPGSRLSPAAALAVLARRSGRLYLPSRRIECSLADPQPLVLFFPEEPR